MKTYFLLLSLLVIHVPSFAQSWLQSEGCHVNVNDSYYQNQNRKDIIGASFKVTIGTDCSATLLNRNTSDDNVGFYLLTAKHCIDGDDLNIEYDLYFNYQSPDEETWSTYPDNRGIINEQSTEDVASVGYHYRHKSKLRLVKEVGYGDLALLEIETPLPPHFNYYYSGWTPSIFYNGLGSILPNIPFTLPSQMVGIHHPRGDIKKINGVNNIMWGETPIATACYTITSAIDAAFGWIWGNTASTQVVCNYVDNPWLVVFGFNYGISEGGSSGSGIFNLNRRVFGAMSGGVSNCDFTQLPTTYGKFRSIYNHTAAKNALNPNHDVWVDLVGLSGRRINCYDYLELPGELPAAAGVSGQYFPADAYQDENRILLQSSSFIETTQDIVVHSGAEYEFRAPEAITLGPGFKVNQNATFKAEIGGCIYQPNKSSRPSLEDNLIARMKSISVPESMTFKCPAQESNVENAEYHDFNVFPNPASTSITVGNLNNNSAHSFHIVDVMGSAVKVGNLNNGNAIDVSHLIPGFYFITIENQTLKFVKR